MAVTPGEKNEVSSDDGVAESVPRGVRVAGAWSWRLLAIGAVITVVILLIVELRTIVIPVMVAVLVAALLVPYVAFLMRHHWPKWLAVLTAMLSALVVVGGLLFLAVSQVVREAPSLRTKGIDSYDQFKSWLMNGPLGLSQDQINAYLRGIGDWLQGDSKALLSGALTVGTTLGHLLTGLLLALFSLLFILIDGKGIWSWIVHVFPRKARPALDGAGQVGWTTLGNFVRTQILVATIDAVGIGLGAFILQLPLVLPIAALVFLGSFIPIVGAVLTGFLAVAIALLYNGWVAAIFMLAVVLAVQQVEGHVLQPLIMGSAVKVHPLAVVLVVATGALVAGIAGALFAVPFAAMLNVMVQYISSGVWRTGRETAFAPSRPLWQQVPRTPRRRRD